MKVNIVLKLIFTVETVVMNITHGDGNLSSMCYLLPLLFDRLYPINNFALRTV